MRHKRKAAIKCLNQIHIYFKSSINVKGVSDEELGSSESFLLTDDEEYSEHSSDEKYSENSHDEIIDEVDIDNIDDCILKESSPKISKSAMKNCVKAIQAASLHLRARQTDIDSGLSLLKWHFNTNFNHFDKLSKSAYWADKILIDADRGSLDIFDYLNEAFFPTKEFMIDISKTDKKIELLGSLSTINVLLSSSVQLRNQLPPLSSVCVPNPVVDQHGAFINTGTFIKRMSWAPLHPQLHQDQFLAVAVYRELAERCSATESGRGSDHMIQIYNCGPLTMSTRKAGTPRLEMVLAHGWGRVTDMSWSPQPLPAVSRSQRLIGHLAVCCTDGFVRIIPIGKLLTPGCLVVFDINHPVLCLGPVRTGNTGVFPTTMNWRKQFPDRLVVGYNNGAVAMFVLSSEAFSAARTTRVVMNVCLRPAMVRYVFHGAACRSIQMCPHDWQLVAVSSTMAAHTVLVDFRPQSTTTFPSNIDIEPTVGARVIWPSPGDVIVLAVAKHIGNNPGLFVCAAQRPPKHARKLYSPLISAIGFCDSLNIVPMGTRTGQLSLVSLNTNHINQLLKPRSASYKDYRDGPMKSKFYFQYCLVPTDDIQPALVPVKSEYPVRTIGCTCAASLQCVHKLLAKYSISITETEDNELQDWQLGAMLHINEIATNPNPASCTWIAVSLECGLIHLVPLTHFYSSELDKISTGSSCNVLDIAAKQLFDEFILPKTLTYFTKYGRPRKTPLINLKKDKRAKIKSETTSVHFGNAESIISASLFSTKTKNSFITDYFIGSPKVDKRIARSSKIIPKSPINRSPARRPLKNSKKAETRSNKNTESKLIMRFKRGDKENSISSVKWRLLSHGSSGGRFQHNTSKPRSNPLESSSESNSNSSMFDKNVRSHKSKKSAKLRSTRASKSSKKQMYSSDSTEESENNTEKLHKIKSFRKRLRSCSDEPSKVNNPRDNESTEMEVSANNRVTRSRSKSSISNSRFHEIPSPILRSNNRLSFSDFLNESDSIIKHIGTNSSILVEEPAKISLRKRLVSIDSKENSIKIDNSQIEVSTRNPVTRSRSKSVVPSFDKIPNPKRHSSTKLSLPDFVDESGSNIEVIESNSKLVEETVKKRYRTRQVSIDSSEDIQEKSTKMNKHRVEISTNNPVTRSRSKSVVPSIDKIPNPKRHSSNRLSLSDYLDESNSNIQGIESSSKLVEEAAKKPFKNRPISIDSSEDIQEKSTKINKPQVEVSMNYSLTRSRSKSSVSNSSNVPFNKISRVILHSNSNLSLSDYLNESDSIMQVIESNTKLAEAHATKSFRKRIVSINSTEHIQKNSTEIDIPQVEMSTSNRMTRSALKSKISSSMSLVSGDDITSPIVNSLIVESNNKSAEKPSFVSYNNEHSTKIDILQVEESTRHRVTRSSFKTLISNNQNILSDDEMHDNLKKSNAISQISESDGKIIETPTTESLRKRLISHDSDLVKEKSTKIDIPQAEISASHRFTRNSLKSSISEMPSPIVSSRNVLKECDPIIHIVEYNSKPLSINYDTKSSRKRLRSYDSEFGIEKETLQSSEIDKTQFNGTTDHRVTRNISKPSISNNINIPPDEEMLNPISNSDKLIISKKDSEKPKENQSKTKLSKKKAIPEKKTINKLQKKRKKSDKKESSKNRKRSVIDDSSDSEEIVPCKRTRTSYSRNGKKTETPLLDPNNLFDSTNSPSFSNDFEMEECLTTVKSSDYKFPNVDPPEDKKSDKHSSLISNRQDTANCIVNEAIISSPQKSRKNNSQNVITFTAFKRMLNTDIDDEDNDEVYINIGNRDSTILKTNSQQIISTVPTMKPIEQFEAHLNKSPKTVTSINEASNKKPVTHEEPSPCVAVSRSNNKQLEMPRSPFDKFKTAPMSQSTPKAHKIGDQSFNHNEPKLVLVKSKTKVDSKTMKDPKKTKTKTKDFDVDKVNKLQSIFSIKRRELLENQSMKTTNGPVVVVVPPSPSIIVRPSWWTADSGPQKVPDVDLDINKIDDISLGVSSCSPKKKLNSSCCTEDRMDKIKKVIDRGVSQSDIDSNTVKGDHPELLQPFRPLKSSKSVNYSPSNNPQMI